MKPRTHKPKPRARSGTRFGYPDMNPATLLFLIQELRRARSQYPTNEKNMDLILHYTTRLTTELYEYAAGRSNAITVQTTALQIAVMAIRLSEEGIAGHPYKGNAPVLPGPMGEYVSAHGFDIPRQSNPALDKLTERFTRK